MRRSLAVVSVLLLLSIESPLLSGQAQSTGATQGSTSAESSSAVSTNPMLDLLKSPKAGTRAKAARELGKAQDPTTVPALADALSDPSDKVRREVIIALAQIHQPDSLEALIKATRDTDDECRVLAVQSLVGYYTGTVPTAGFGGFVKKNWDRAKEHFNADTTRINPGVPVDPKVIAALDSTLNGAGSNRASQEAAKGLGILVAESAVPDHAGN